MPIRIAKIKNIGSGKYWWGCGETGLLMHHWWGFKIVQSSWKRLATSWKKIKHATTIFSWFWARHYRLFSHRLSRNASKWEVTIPVMRILRLSKVKHLLDAQSHKACMDFRPAFSYILVSKLLPTCKERTLWLQDCKLGEWWCLGKGSHLSGILGCLPPAPVTRPLAKKTPLAKPPSIPVFPSHSC